MNKKIFSIVIMSILFFAMIGGNVFAWVESDDVSSLSSDEIAENIKSSFNSKNIDDFFCYVNYGYSDLSSEQKEEVDPLIEYSVKNYKSQLLSATNKLDPTEDPISSQLDSVWNKFEGGKSFTSNASSGSKSDDDKKKAADDWFGQATSWWGDAKKSGFTIPQEAQDVIDQFTDMINIIGTTLIFVATIVLGIKFIFGSIDGKSEAKEDMITLLVACVFFFGWNGIMGILLNNAHDDIAIVEGETSYVTVISKMLTVFRTISNCLLVVGVIYVGIKFIFAGAQGKADLKAKSGFFIIGIILAFCTVNVLTFLSDVINQVLTKT